MKWKQQYKHGLYISKSQCTRSLTRYLQISSVKKKTGKRKASRSYNRTVTVHSTGKAKSTSDIWGMHSLMSGLQSVKRRIRKWSDLNEHLRISATCWPLPAETEHQVPQKPHIRNCGVTLTRTRLSFRLLGWQCSGSYTFSSQLIFRYMLPTDASCEGKNSKLEATLHIMSGINKIEQEIKRNIQILKQ